MKNLTITMLVCLCFYGNTQEIPVAKKHPAENVIQINLYDAYQNAKVYPLSTVAESVEYLPLETTEDCLLGEYLANIFIGENDIIVFDYAYAYRFTPEGKFLNKIGKKGRGPGEYNRPMRIAVDPNQQVVYFEDRGKIVKYGYNGDFLKEYTVAVTTSKILQYSEDVFLVDKMMYSYAEPGERYSMYFFQNKKRNLSAGLNVRKKIIFRLRSIRQLCTNLMEKHLSKTIGITPFSGLKIRLAWFRMLQ
jgi:hypothetical protein